MPESPESLSEYPAELAPPAASLKKPEREGLPAGYRMRADAHYVDQLTAPRGERASAESRAAARRGDPDTVADVRERRSDRVLAQLAEDVATMGSAAALLANEPSPMARRVNLDLIRVQAWRAAWLLRAQAILDGTHQGQVRARQLGSLLTQLREGFAPECRLAGIGLQIDTTDWRAAVSVDEPAFVAGVAGAMIATLGLVGQGEYAAIRVAATVAGGELETVDVIQEDVAAPAGAVARFFDPGWIDRPGGWTAAFGASTARAVAQLHRGDASLVVGDRRGTTVRLKF